MKPYLMIMTSVGLLAFVAMAGLARAQSPIQCAETQAVLIKQLSDDVKQLRMEVIQQVIELQNWKIKQLERNLQPIQSQRQRLVEQEQAVKQLIAEIEQQPNVTPAQEGPIGAMETMKGDYAEKESKDLSIKQQLIVQRETELVEQLEQEQLRLHEIIKLREPRKLKVEGPR